jgi:pimeloyl-ACP methyl ester carboxylesterase
MVAPWHSVGSAPLGGAPASGQVKVPTLVLHGTDDRRVSVAAARHLPRHIPDARLHVFEGRGRLSIFTATAEFCETLVRFVRTGDVRHERPPFA